MYAVDNANFSEIREGLYHVSDITFVDSEQIPSPESSEEMRGIWVSQFDMHPIYRDGNKQRDKSDYIEKVSVLIDNLANDGFNTVFLQIRPNGDSMYKSEFYPTSKYIAGIYGGELEYDAVEIFINIAEDKNLSVHAWINPYRLCREDELLSYGQGVIFEWYKEGLGKRIELGTDGILYLDPSYPEVDELIVNGVKEVLNKYNFEGIHLDDYFYPTEFEFNDEKEFLLSGYDNKGDFRRSNTDRTVKAIYNAVHKYKDKVFGIAPAGNIYSLKEGWYIDIRKWCSNEGYIDYIMPQLYYGFNNRSCPFDVILADWSKAVTNSKIRLYIGLSAAKCVLGSQGVADEYAGKEGEYEWRDNKDILARELRELRNISADGFCIFTYSSFYDPLSGNENDLCLEEKTAFCINLKGS